MKRQLKSTEVRILNRVASWKNSKWFNSWSEFQNSKICGYFVEPSSLMWLRWRQTWQSLWQCQTEQTQILLYLQQQWPGCRQNLNYFKKPLPWMKLMDLFMLKNKSNANFLNVTTMSVQLRACQKKSNTLTLTWIQLVQNELRLLKTCRLYSCMLILTFLWTHVQLYLYFEQKDPKSMLKQQLSGLLPFRKPPSAAFELSVCVCTF